MQLLQSKSFPHNQHLQYKFSIQMMSTFFVTELTLHMLFFDQWKIRLLTYQNHATNDKHRLSFCTNLSLPMGFIKLVRKIEEKKASNSNGNFFFSVHSRRKISKEFTYLAMTLWRCHLVRWWPHSIWRWVWSSWAHEIKWWHLPASSL